jgi:hypothetical protein
LPIPLFNNLIIILKQTHTAYAMKVVQKKITALDDIAFVSLSTNPYLIRISDSSPTKLSRNTSTTLQKLIPTRRKVNQNKLHFSPSIKNISVNRKLIVDLRMFMTL